MSRTIHQLAALVTSNISDFERGMKRAARSTHDLRDAWLKAGRDISNAATRITGALGALSGLIAKQFADFEATMNRAGAVTRTIGTEDFAVLTEKAKEMGEATIFSATQAAEAIEKMGLAGLNTKEIITALPGALELAAAAQISIAEAADVAAKNMRAFGLDAEELTRINDVMVATFTRSNTDIRQLAEAMKHVAPVSKALGVSIEETAAVLGRLGDAGFQGSIAGTSFRNILSRLAGAVPAATKQLAALGVTTTDATGKMLPFFDILEQIERQALTDAQILQIFGARGGPQLLALLEVGTDGLRQFTTEIESAGGVSKVMAEQFLTTIKGQFILLTSAIEGVVLAVGENLRPTFEELIQTFIEFLNANRPEIIETMTVAVQSLTSSGVRLIQFANEAAPAFFEVFRAIQELMKPITQFIAAHPGILGAMLALKAASMLGVTQAVISLGAALGQTVQAIWGLAIPALRSLAGSFTAAGVSATAAWAAATLGISLLVTAIVGIGVALAKAIGKFQEATGFFDPFIEFGRELRDILLSAVREIWAELEQELAPALIELGTLLKNELLPIIKELVVEFVKSLKPVLIDLAPRIGEMLVTAVRNLVAIIRALVPLLRMQLSVVLKVIEAAVRVQITIWRQWITVMEKALRLAKLTKLGSAAAIAAGLVVGDRDQPTAEAGKDRPAASAPANPRRDGPVLQAAPMAGGADGTAATGEQIGQQAGEAAGEAAANVINRQAEQARTEIEQQIREAQRQALESQMAEGFGQLLDFMQQEGVTGDQVQRFAGTVPGATPGQAASLAGQFAAAGGASADPFVLEQLAANFTRMLENARTAQEAATQRSEVAKTSMIGFLDRLIELRDAGTVGAQWADVMAQEAHQLAQKFQAGDISAREFSKGMTRLQQETDKATEAAARRRQEEEAQAKRETMLRLLQGKGTKDDMAFLQQQKQAAMMSLFDQQLQQAFNNMFGLNQVMPALSNGFNNLNHGIQNFGQQLNQVSIGGGNAPSLDEAASQLNSFFNSVEGQIVSIRQNIEMAEQRIEVLRGPRGNGFFSFGFGKSKHFEIKAAEAELQALYRRLNQLLYTPPPALFPSGGSDGSVFTDPGLQTAGQKPNVTVNLEFRSLGKPTNSEARQIVEVVEGHLQRSGSNRFF